MPVNNQLPFGPQSGQPRTNLGQFAPTGPAGGATSPIAAPTPSGSTHGLVAPNPHDGQSAPPPPGKNAQDLVAFAMLLRGMSGQEREKAYPQVIKSIAAAGHPDVAMYMRQNGVPTDSELDQILLDKTLPKGYTGMGESSPRASRPTRPPKPPELPKSKGKAAEGDKGISQETYANLDRLDAFEKIIDKYPDIIGPGAKLKMGVRQVGKFMEEFTGTDLADDEKLAASEFLKSLTMDFVMGRIAQTKGSISEKEMDAFKESVLGMENTLQGNKRLIQHLRTAEGRVIEHSVFKEQYKDRFGSSKGVDAAWRKYQAHYPPTASNNIGNFIKYHKSKSGINAQDAVDFRVNKYFDKYLSQ